MRLLHTISLIIDGEKITGVNINDREARLKESVPMNQSNEVMNVVLQFAKFFDFDDFSYSKISELQHSDIEKIVGLLNPEQREIITTIMEKDDGISRDELCDAMLKNHSEFTKFNLAAQIASLNRKLHEYGFEEFLHSEKQRYHISNKYLEQIKSIINGE